MRRIHLSAAITVQQRPFTRFLKKTYILNKNTTYNIQLICKLKKQTLRRKCIVTLQGRISFPISFPNRSVDPGSCSGAWNNLKPLIAR